MNSSKTRRVDVAVIGAGHAGLNAIKEIRRHTDRYVLINGGPLGTTCARHGCMPSKALIEWANARHQVGQLERLGLSGDREHEGVDTAAALENLRDLRDTFVDLILANSTDEMGDQFIEGYARLIGRNRLLLDNGMRIEANAIVVATGGRTSLPDEWVAFADEALTSENVFELDRLPSSVGIIGLGPIGLELGQALARLGVDTYGFERSAAIAGICDPEIAAEASAIFNREFPVFCGSRIDIRREGGQYRIRQDGDSVVVDRLLFATGRHSLAAGLGWDRIGIPVGDSGLPYHDPGTLRVPETGIYIAGDANGGPANLQRAAIEGRVAGHNAACEDPVLVPQSTPMSIVFSDPNIAAVGRSWDLLEPDSTVVARVRFGAVGRAMIMRRNRGLLKLYADRRSRRLLGGCMVGPGCEHIAHLLAGFVQQGLTIDDARAMPFYHPVIEEALQDGLDELGRLLEANRAYVGGPPLPLSQSTAA